MSRVRERDVPQPDVAEKENAHPNTREARELRTRWELRPLSEINRPAWHDESTFEYPKFKPRPRYNLISDRCAREVSPIIPVPLTEDGIGLMSPLKKLKECHFSEYDIVEEDEEGNPLVIETPSGPTRYVSVFSLEATQREATIHPASEADHPESKAEADYLESKAEADQVRRSVVALFQTETSAREPDKKRVRRVDDDRVREALAKIEYPDVIELPEEQINIHATRAPRENPAKQHGGQRADDIADTLGSDASTPAGSDTDSNHDNDAYEFYHLQAHSQGGRKVVVGKRKANSQRALFEKAGSDHMKKYGRPLIHGSRARLKPGTPILDEELAAWSVESPPKGKENRKCHKRRRITMRISRGGVKPAKALLPVLKEVQKHTLFPGVPSPQTKPVKRSRSQMSQDTTVATPAEPSLNV